MGCIKRLNSSLKNKFEKSEETATIRDEIDTAETTVRMCRDYDWISIEKATSFPSRIYEQESGY